MRKLASVLWVDLLAIVPFAVLVLAAKDPLDAFARIDPFIVFRLFVLVWVVCHLLIIVQRFIADLQGARDSLAGLEARWPEARGIAAAGDHIWKWSLWRVVGLALRHSWLTMLLLIVVLAVNVTATLIFAHKL